MRFQRYELEVTLQPAYDLRKLEIEICDFQEQGLCLESDDSNSANIYGGFAVRRDSVFRACVHRTCS